MNKFLGLILLSLAFSVCAAAPTAPTIYGPASWECILSYDVITNGATQNLSAKGVGKDTIVGADTMRLLNKQQLEKGYNYVLQITDSCAAADTLKFVQKVYGSDGSTLMAASYNLDSLVGTNDGGLTQIQLTAGQTVFGSRVSVEVIGWISTVRALIRRVELYRVKSGVLK